MKLKTLAEAVLLTTPLMVLLGYIYSNAEVLFVAGTMTECLTAVTEGDAWYCNYK